MVTSRLTWSGASVGVSISTQRRMPSRIVAESKGFEDAVVSMLSPSWEFNHPYFSDVQLYIRGSVFGMSTSGRRQWRAQTRDLTRPGVVQISGFARSTRIVARCVNFVAVPACAD